MEITGNTWKFPENVDFSMAHLCLSQLKSITRKETLIIDLSNTEHIHSSFIGFLIQASQIIKKEGGELDLLISPTIKKIFLMLKILDYFPGLNVKDPSLEIGAETVIN